MTDFESRLRAAMAASAEPPPAGLLDGIYGQHRRHVRRVVTACAAVVAVGVAGTVVTRGVLASPAAVVRLRRARPSPARLSARRRGRRAPRPRRRAPFSGTASPATAAR